jgi:hypothetical protein
VGDGHGGAGGAFEGACGKFEEGFVDGVALVVDEEDAAIGKDREDDDGTGVDGDFAGGGFAGVGGDGAEDEFDAVAGVEEVVGGLAGEGAGGIFNWGSGHGWAHVLVDGRDGPALDGMIGEVLRVIK